MRQRSSAHTAAAYDEGSGAGFVAPRLVVIVALVAAIGSTAHGLWGASRPVGAQPEPASLSATPTPEPLVAVAAPVSSSTPTPTPEPSATPTPVPTPLPTFTPAVPLQRVAIVAGHWGSDSGAVCPDGLQEVDINLDVAQRVISLLGSLGYQADLMKEFDPRLNGYFALALVSIHTDSCEPYPDAVPAASGFKVASVVSSESMVPEAEARLVNCLSQAYSARTDLPFHSNSVTVDMDRYHTFYKVDARTPAAIIEIGFMYADYPLLTERRDLVAQGIVDGIVCFLREGPGL